MKKGSFWFGIVSGIIISGLVGFGLSPYLGVFDATATGKLNILDWWGDTNMDNYVENHAPDSPIPASADPAAGFDHYREMCLHCHGAPDAAREGWAEHMLPLPPKLWEEDTQKMTDGELFYIVKNGIRMTGMPAFGPTHSDSDLWNIVAFLRQLDKLSPQQKEALQKTAAGYPRD